MVSNKDKVFIKIAEPAIDVEDMPFGSMYIEKKAYSLRDFPMDKWKEEVERYVANEHTFISRNLGALEFKTINKETKDAIGQIPYKGNNVEFIIPILIDSGELKDVDMVIMDGKFYPLDEEFIFNELYKKEGHGEVYKRTFDLDDNYDALHHGLFEARSGVFTSKIASMAKDFDLPQDTIDRIEKIASHKAEDEIIDVIGKEDPFNPYHFHASIMKKAGREIQFDHAYMSASELKHLKAISKSASEGRASKSIESDERIDDIPALSAVDKSGKFEKVFTGDDIKPGFIIKTHALFESKSGYIVVSDSGGECISLGDGEDKGADAGLGNTGDFNRVIDNTSERSFMYTSKAYGHKRISGHRSYVPNCLSVKVNESEGYMGSHIAICKDADVDHVSSLWLSNPYYVMGENTYNLGDGLEYVRVLRVESLENRKTALLWLHADVDEITKADRDKIKNAGIYNLIVNFDEVFLIPDTHEIISLGKPIKERNINNVYGDMVKTLAVDYNGKVKVEQFGNDSYDVEIMDKNANVKKYEDLSGNNMLMLTNYYLGTNYDDPKNIKTASHYDVKCDFDFSEPMVIKRRINRYQGEFMKTASFFYKYFPMLKEAEITDAVNAMTGVEYVDDVDDHNLSSVKRTLIDAINNVGNILMMSRLGKLKLNESVSKKAMMALSSLVNELSGRNKYYG